METDKIKWIFFDIGSTLVDESACEIFHVRQLAVQSGAPDIASISAMIQEKARKLQPAYKQVAKELHLKTSPWPRHLESLLPNVPEALEYLRHRYHLGIIANQDPGTEARLTAFGIREYFDVIVASAEEGVAKPDSAIFLRALKKADCRPDEAVMVGDRPDNDISPAAELGMHTVWVRQGIYSCADIRLIRHKPDVTINSISEIKNHL